MGDREMRKIALTMFTDDDLERVHDFSMRILLENGVQFQSEKALAIFKKHGFKVMMHTGGTSIPGSSTVTAEMVIATDPDIVSHINGGPTAVAPEEIKKLVSKTNFWLELVHCGNNKAAIIAVEEGKKCGALGRFIIGNDAPSGTGVVPLGILRMICHVASLCGVPAAEAFAMATGNPAKAFGLNRGLIAEGREADLVVMDAPMGAHGTDVLAAMAEGDIPAVSLVLVDGLVTVNTSRNTPPPVHKPVVK